MKAVAWLSAASLLTAQGAGGPPDLFGADKIKHFLMSALIQSATFSVARAAGLNRATSQAAGGTAVFVFGVGKELYDRHAHKTFSVADLLWDAGGGVAAASLLNGAR
jgi:uncharacterized protein YfiM (DUF2279 family)